MPILRFLFRKMWNTRWLTLSSLLGLIVAVSFTVSIPMYSDGSLKRVVATSLDERSSGLPAGSLLLRYQAAGSDRAELEDFKNVDTYIREKVPEDIGFPYTTFARSLSIRSTQVTPVDPSLVDASKRRQMSVVTLDDLAGKVDIIQGRMFNDTAANGTIEAIVLDESLYRLDYRLGDEFYYPLTGGLGIAPLKIKVVGTYMPIDENDPYWFQGLESLLSSFFISDHVFVGDLLESKNIPLNLANWYYNFDFVDIKMSQIMPLSRTLDRMDIMLYQQLRDTKVDISFQQMLNEFRQQGIQLQILLFTLAAPMLAMVFYFIVMNAKQSLERQRTDIAVLRSRGGSTRQIIWIYLLEGVLLGGITMLVAPFIGWFMAKSIGSSNGFLTFVERKAIPVDVSPESLLYGGIAVLIAIAASVIPAIRYAGSTIVGNKQLAARADRKPFWQKWFLDVLLIGVAVYGWYMFNDRQMLSMRTGLTSDQLQVHPLLFFVPAISIFALGLFFLRIFPMLLKLFNWMGKRYLPVPIYLTLAQLSRSSNAYYPLMLLLILTLGLGVYNASAARTIDLNSTERLLYQYGTDVIIETIWEGYTDFVPQQPQQPPQQPNPNDPPTNNPPPQQPGGGFEPPSRIRYVEPPFEIFRQMEGVEAAARVLLSRGNVVVSGRSQGVGMLMGIDNVDFFRVGWFRDDLFPAAPHRYLNLLGAYEHGVLIPSSFANQRQLEPGDVITIVVNQEVVEFVIVGILPYWPSQYPEQMPFFIANLDYIYDQAPMLPYQVWLKMEEGALLAPVIESLQEQGVAIASVNDVRRELIAQSRHPARGGVFGILSLGFLVSVLVTLVGYVLYWFFNLSSRVVQFGVLRAMGLSRRQLTFMLLLEQGFTAGLSILLGIGIGKLTSYVFLPFLQTSENVRTQVPPFRVVFEARDTLQLYIVVGFMMITGAMLLFMHIRRLRVHQAVKLGEER